MERSASPSQSAPPETLSGGELRGALAASADWLDRHAEAINALNVFPVPDGDTGLNMSLTLRAATEGAQVAADGSLGEVAAAMARGAMMGARGNSGVILAQFLRAFAGALERQESAGARRVAAALSAGAEAAYGALTVPVEGTILTVAREAARAAEEAAAEADDLIAALDRAHRAARLAVAATPDQLPILKQAGVVDSGGEGFRVFLEGMLMHLRREAPAEGPVRIDMRADLASLHDENCDFYGYCTEVLFQGAGLPVARVRERLDALGTSVLVIGDSELLKVHVHTLRPGAVLDLATELGEIVKVKIDNMQLQHEEFARENVAAAAPEVQPGTAIVAVALGEGLQQIFESLGALVVSGGRTMNPSVEDIVAAARAADRTDIVVLPNDKNVTLAARQAADFMENHRMAVVATENIPQGIAAALALNPDADLDINVAAIEAAARRAHCIELTRAVRAAKLEGLSIAAGDWLALLDGRPAATADSPRPALEAAIEKLGDAGFEIATIYVGAEGGEEEARSLGEIITSQTGAPVEIAAGGQPHYPYIVSLE